MDPSSEKLLIGAHTSAAGGAHNAIREGKQIGATTVQLFTRNQKRWENKPLEEIEINLFKEAVEDTGLSEIMCHDSYLINLGCPDPVNLEKSRTAFKKEILRCQQFGITYLNFHPGAALKESEEKCLETIAESLKQIAPMMENSPTRLLMETTAGQGSTVGYSFEHHAYLIERLHKIIPIGVCMDTCHTFTAGYDMRTKEDVDNMLKEFDKVVGLEHLFAFHLNDSMRPFASRLDRHSPLGEGEIGIECFKALMTHKATRHIPKYLETPGGPPLWEKEIAMLRKFAN